MPSETFMVHNDAFSSGQISSKIWLCEMLEKHLDANTDHVIWFYGGWHGIAPFMLLLRNNLRIQNIRSFDLDPSCQHMADSILENWVWQEWKFKAFTADCNDIDPAHPGQFGSVPTVVVNTSTEHFESNEWYRKIPAGTIVALQSNNMDHEDHHDCVKDLEQFKAIYADLDLMYSGSLDFSYPTWSFSRYMLIGKKR